MPGDVAGILLTSQWLLVSLASGLIFVLDSTTYAFRQVIVMPCRHEQMYLIDDTVLMVAGQCPQVTFVSLLTAEVVWKVTFQSVPLV